MSSLGSCIYTFGRYKKVNSKNGLGELLILTTLHLGKDWSLLYSAKCSVSTQLTYIQKNNTIQQECNQYNQGFNKAIFKMHLYTFLHLELIPGIFCDFLEFLVSWISCQFSFFFSPLLVPICKFLQNQYRFV